MHAIDATTQATEPVFADRTPQVVREPKKLLQFKLPLSRVLKFHEYAAAEFGQGHGAKTRFLEKLLADYEASLEELGMSSLYATDFTAWAEQTAKLLREGRFAEIDMPALLEEIDGLARSDRKAIYNQLKRLLFHLLKLAYFSERHHQRVSAGWKRTVVSARHEIEESISDSPSLVHYPATRLAEAYDKVRREAGVLPHFPDDAVPESCPWSIEQVLDPSFFPSRDNG